MKVSEVMGVPPSSHPMVLGILQAGKWLLPISAKASNGDEARTGCWWLSFRCAFGVQNGGDED